MPEGQESLSGKSQRPDSVETGLSAASEDGHEKVVKALREAIVSGELSPNQRLIEADLATSYAVGRSAVRTALLILEQEGLVERQRNRGVRIREIPLEEAIEIAEVRMLVEGLCAARAAERATEAELTELNRILTELRHAVEAGDVMGYSDLNHSLHRRIRESSRHSTATEIVGRLRNQMVRHQFRLLVLPGRASTSMAEHEAIVAAIARGDAEGAQQAMHEHIRSVIEAFKQFQRLQARRGRGSES